MRLLVAATLTALAALAVARPADACSIRPDPTAIVLGDRAAVGDRPLFALARIPSGGRLALRGPGGAVALEVRGRFARPRKALTAGAEYRLVLRGGKERELTRFTVGAGPAAPPRFAGLTVVDAGMAPPRTTCEAGSWAVTVDVRALPDGSAPTGFLYVYDRRPDPRAPLRGLRGVVAAATGPVRLGRVGISLSFEPSWSPSPPSTVWVAPGDAAGHLGAPLPLALP